MNNGQLAHKWVHEADLHKTASNLIAKGSKIFSYGHHYCIATKANGVFFVNASPYSVSTARHVALVRAAIPSYETVFSSDNGGSTGVIRHYEHEMQQAADKAVTAKSKKKDYYLNRIEHCKAKIVEFCKLYKLPCDIQNVVDVSAYFQERARKAEEKRKREEKKRAKELQANLAAWRSGAQNWDLPRGTWLRVRGGMVETSKRADMPLAVALRLRAMILAGETVEHYAGYRVTVGKDSVEIGCHSITINEIRTFFGGEA